MSDDLDQLCVADDRCRAYDRARRTAALLETALPLCMPCLDGAQLDVGRLLWDYQDLANIIPRLGGGGEVVSGSKERPTPLRLDVEALMAEIRHVTTTWEHVARDVDSLSDPVEHGVRGGWAVQTAVQVLQPRVYRIAAVEKVEVFPTGVEDESEPMSGAEGLLALVDLHRAARRKLGLTRKTNEVWGACPSCGLGTLMHDDGRYQTALARDDGDEVVYCRACDEWMTWDEYERYAGLAATWALQHPERRLEVAGEAMTGGRCGCTCHGMGRAFARCSVSGGCGSQGCDGTGALTRRSA